MGIILSIFNITKLFMEYLGIICGKCFCPKKIGKIIYRHAIFIL